MNVVYKKQLVLDTGLTVNYILIRMKTTGGKIDWMTWKVHYLRQKKAREYILC